MSIDHIIILERKDQIMGMFDSIIFEAKCPRCAEVVNDFQSKDNVCELKSLHYWEVNNFYHSCNNCGAWIEYNLDESYRRQQIPIECYKVTAELPEERQKRRESWEKLCLSK